jgi:hypothetical protein
LPPPEHQLDDFDQAILLSLADQPFASIRELSRLTHLPRTTVHRRLMRSLGFRVRHLRWVPHFLSRCQKLDRVRLSRQLLLILERQERRSWHDIVTLGESRFHLHTDHELIWAQPDAEIPKESGTLSNPKSDARHSLESWRFPVGQYPAKRIQIQRELLCNSDS